MVNAIPQIGGHVLGQDFVGLEPTGNEDLQKDVPGPVLVA